MWTVHRIYSCQINVKMIFIYSDVELVEYIRECEHWSTFKTAVNKLKLKDFSDVITDEGELKTLMINQLIAVMND